MRVVAAHPDDHFNLKLFHMLSDINEVVGSVPVINGWAQVELEIKYIPDASEQTEFFRNLGMLRDTLIARANLSAWYFLHKLPGIKVRLHIGENAEGGLNCILDQLTSWRWAWLSRVRFGSFFDQIELLGGFHRGDIDTLLTKAADTYLERMSDKQEVNRAGWAFFVVSFLRMFIADDWIVWEALGRFLRLRSHGLKPQGELQNAFADPRGILTRIAAFEPLQPGFEASVSLLQCLNYVLNMWAIDAPNQLAILEEARVLVRPELAIP